MICDEVLQLGNQRLCLIGSGGEVTHLTKLSENIHQLVAGFLHVLAGGLGFKFLVSCRAAPLFLGFLGITVDLGGIKRRKIHRYHSCFLNCTGVGDEILQMLFLQFQELNLVSKGIHGVKSGAV